MANEICYIEFYSSDYVKTAGFFSEVFGWKTSEMMNNYLSWQAGESAVGGGFSSEGVSESGPRTVAYIQVEDIEVTLKSVEEHGGTVMVPKTRISDEYGFFAWFTEPGGAVVGVWSKT